MYIIWKNSPKNAGGNVRGRRVAGVFNFLVLIFFFIYYFQILINKIRWKYTDKILEIVQTINCEFSLHIKIRS